MSSGIIRTAGFAAALSLLAAVDMQAQTAKSLFLKSDGVQVEELFSQSGDLYKKVGHHGPAVENSMMALRIYFNDSGAIDVYSKSGGRMELLEYLWYPGEEQQLGEDAGCDEYRVGSTVGLGGIAMWDGADEVKLHAGKGRLAKVGAGRRGCYAEMISYGVPYRGDTLDISVRVDVRDDSRFATVTARVLKGPKVRFLTGVNYHPGCITEVGESYIYVWGKHPADVSAHPIPIGGGMVYDSRQFPEYGRTENMLRLISRPARRVRTMVVSASTKEPAVNNPEAFEDLVCSQKYRRVW